MSEVAKNGGTELSEAEKEALAEREAKARYDAFMAEEKAKTAKQSKAVNSNVVPIKLDMTLGARVHGIVAYPGPPRDVLKPKAEAEEAVLQSVVAEIAPKAKTNGAAPKEEPKADSAEEEEALKAEAPVVGELSSESNNPMAEA